MYARLLFALALAGCIGPDLTQMPQELTLRPSGLFTDPNPHSSVPEGALRVADDIVIRRQGIAQPRPGFDQLSASFTGTDPYQAIPYDGDLLVVQNNSGTHKTDWYNAGTPTAVLDEDSADITWDTDHVSGVEARGNLYVNTTGYVRKMTAANDAEAEKVGRTPVPFIDGSASVTGSVLEQYAGRGYKAVFVKTDDNGVEVTSASSHTLVVQNTGATALDPSITVYLPDDIEVGDFLKVYGTPAVTGSASANGVPGEEYFLLLEHEITTSNITADLVSFTDSTVDNDLGAALYTNPSQEGILQGNSIPHTAKSLALYKGSVFYGNTVGPHRVTLVADDSDVLQTGNATGLGYRVANGDITSGVATITNVASVTGMKVGMMVDTTGVFFPKDARVSSITGAGPYTITATENALLTNTGQNVNIVDSIRIKSGSEDNYYPVSSPVTGSIPGWTACMVSINTEASAGSGDGPSTKVRAEMLTRYVVEDNKSVVFPSKVRVLIEELARANESFEVWATHGDEYFPEVPEPTVGSGLASTADVRSNGIQWSKTDQPEHVPEGNFALVGSGKHEILTMVSTKDALFIFKTDGIWRLTGSGALSGWRIDPVDKSTFVLNSRSAVELDGQVYAWTNRGVVMVGQYGVPDENLLSARAIGTDLDAIETELGKYASASPAAFLAANDNTHELMVGAPASASDSTTSNVYVYNTKTRAWTRWVKTLTSMFLNPSDGLLHFVSADDEKLHQERSGGTVNSADLDYSVTINDVTSVTITIAGGSGWTPAVGDALVKGSDVAIVTAVTSATVFDVDMTGLTTGAATGYEGLDCTIEFIAKTGGNPAVRKHFQTSTLIFEDLKGVRSVDMAFTSNIDSTEDSETRSFTRSLVSTQPTEEMFLVPSDHARVTQLWPKVRVHQAAANWELVGLSLTFDFLSPRAGFSENAANLAAGG